MPPAYPRRGHVWPPEASGWLLSGNFLFGRSWHKGGSEKPRLPLTATGSTRAPRTPLLFMLRPSMLNSRHFGRPNEFLPERWSTGHLEVQPHDSKAYAQFGAGPRVCPGRHLAAVEMRLVLSMLSRNFSMELATSPESIKEIAAFTMMPSAMPVRIDNGTLHYHFPSKDALILAVVDYLIEDLKNNCAVSKGAEQTALDELHMEFEDIRLRLRRRPEQFIVLSELEVRSWRDPIVAKMFRKLDEGWHAHLVALLVRGVQQRIFRNNLNVAAVREDDRP
jgi:hypothetical protein